MAYERDIPEQMYELLAQVPVEKRGEFMERWKGYRRECGMPVSSTNDTETRKIELFWAQMDATKAALADVLPKAPAAPPAAAKAKVQ